jgi:hypothetical protein
MSKQSREEKRARVQLVRQALRVMFPSWQTPKAERDDLPLERHPDFAPTAEPQWHAQKGAANEHRRPRDGEALFARQSRVHWEGDAGAVRETTSAAFGHAGLRGDDRRRYEAVVSPGDFSLGAEK